MIINLQIDCRKGGFDDTKIVIRVRQERIVLFTFIIGAYRDYLYSSYYCDYFGLGYWGIHLTKTETG